MIYVTAPVHDYLLQTFKEKGLEVNYVPTITYEELKNEIPDATGIIITTRLKIDGPMLAHANNLKWIGRLGSGLELIDIPYATSKNILCVSSPEGNRNAVAEHSLGMLLSLLHKIHSSANEVHNRVWHRSENRGTELSGKTIGLIGYGNTGSSFAKLLQGFDVLIMAYDKYKSDFGNLQIREAHPEQILKHADIISFHVPLTEETKYMGNKAFFDAAEKKPLVLNTSRGKIIKTSDLIDALKNEKISGAGLDVLENENLNTQNAEEIAQLEWLTAQPNVIVTPHIAGYSHEAYYKMSAVIVEKLKQAGMI